jgi:hypothetical protein
MANPEYIKEVRKFLEEQVKIMGVDKADIDKPTDEQIEA